MFAASKSGRSSAGGGATDASFAYVPLLLETTSTNGQQNNTFLDSSSNTFTITRNGTPTQGSITPYWPNGQWSNYFNGSSDRFSLGTNAALNPGTNFTFECWIYSTGTTTNSSLFEGATGGLSVTFNGSNQLSVAQSGVGYLITDPTAFALANQWVHIAVVRSGMNLSLYKNGTRVATSAANATSFVTVTQNYIAFNGGAAYFPGYISNLRLVKGTAVYDPTLTTLTIPTSPLTAITNTSLLICQSNRFIDNASSPNTITLSGTPRVQAFQPFSPTASYTTALYGGSGYLASASSSYLTSTITAVSPSIAVFECWVYNNTLDNSAGNHYLQIQNGAATNYALTHDTNGTARFLSRNDSNGAIFDITAASVIKTNQWQYIVGMRNATTASLYVDGVRVSTASVSVSTTSGTSLYISGNAGTTRLLDGYMANARIVSGSLPSGYDPASTTIAVPTAPLTNVTNTKILLNFSNAGIYDAAVQNNAITVGDAQVSTTQSKWSPTSMKFDGTGDALNIASNPALNFGSGSFTLEAWVYLTTMSGDFFTIGSFGSGGAFFGFRTADIGYGRPGVAWDYQAASGMVVNNWYHIAYSRSGTSMRMFVNGTQVGTTQTTSQAYDLSLTYTTVGALQNANFLNGYIQDLRITKGIGRYTANFSVPTAAFPTR
jgi:hypothetical protein